MPFEMSGPADEALLRDALRQVMERNTAFTLVASDGISERIFYFAIGGVRVIGSGPRRSPSVGEALLSRGDIDLDAYNRVMESIGDDDRRFAEAAVHMGILNSAKLQSGLEEQVQEEVLELFFWEGAELILSEGQPPKSFYEGKFQTAHVGCDLVKLLGGVLERADCWRETVSRLPGGREVYEVTDKGQHEGAGRWQRLVSLLDGTRTAVEAIEKSNSRRVAAYEFLMLALHDGRVRRTVGGAAQRVSREQLLKDIEQLEAALKVRVEADIVRTRLARTLEQAGENSRAAGHWRALGDKQRRVNELDRALAAYSEAVRVLPTDFATRELILEIYRHKQDWPQVVSHGRPLADLFVKHNLLNRAKHLLLQLVGLEPNDAGLRRQLIFVLIGLGERDLALRHLRELAKILEARGATASELRDVYIRILALDPRDLNARKRFEQITGIASARRLVKITIGSTVGVLALLAACYMYEGAARKSANDAVETARQQVKNRDLAGAKRTLEEASSRYRMSRAVKHIDGFLREVERLQREEQDRAQRRKLMLEQAGMANGPDIRDEKAAAGMAKEAERLLREGHPVEAHRVLRDLCQVHGATDVAHEAKFPLALQVLPRDARVIVNGVAVGAGSLIVEYLPSGKTLLQVEADGFSPYREVLEGVQEPSISVNLHRPVLWTHSLEASCDAPPLVSGKVAYACGRDRFLTAISLTDGATLWRQPLGLYSDTGSSPVVVGDGIVVATSNGDLVCAAADSGEIRWRKPLGLPIETQPAAVNDLVVVVPKDGSVQCFDAAGEVKWKLPARTVTSGGAATRIGAAQPGLVGWIDPKGTYSVVSVADGKSQQRAPTTAVLRGTPVVGGDDRLWAHAEDESVRLLAAGSGAALRRFPMPRAIWDGPVALNGDNAYAVAADGSVACFKANGETAFRKRLEEAPSAPCAADDGFVYVPGMKGRLQVLDAASGELRWTYDAKARLSARPVAAAGVVLVVTSTGMLHCLER